MNEAISVERRVFSVSALVGAAKELLEAGFSGVAVEGEISNLARPRSGHVYFTLKDEGAQLRCALFRREAEAVGFALADGLKVLARGRLSIYPARGEFQLYVSSLQEAGLGALQRAFEALKRKLTAEGLFDEAAKRSFPPFPSRIGVVTSPTGAALRDILNVLGRRYPPTAVLIYPAQVQGAAAAATITAALQLAGARGQCEVIILARGGGSLEDLWPFNEEAVARAIRSCPIPVVTGVGHETDFTIADFAADLRAPTPSAAAAAVVPDAAELLVRLGRDRRRLSTGWKTAVAECRHSVAALAHRLKLQHPRRRLQERALRLDELGSRLASLSQRLVETRRARMGTLRSELRRLSQQPRIARLHLETRAAGNALAVAIRTRLERQHSGLATIAARLQTLGPEQTLARGYAIVFDDRGRVLRETVRLEHGAKIAARLARGGFTARVEDIDKGK